jgi:hypothetical protein
MVSAFLRNEEEFIRHLLAVQELVYTMIHAQSSDIDLMLVEDSESLEKFDERAWNEHPGFLGSIKSIVVEYLKVKRSRATGLSSEAKMAYCTDLRNTRCIGGERAGNLRTERIPDSQGQVRIY